MKLFGILEATGILKSEKTAKEGNKYHGIF